MKEKLSKFATKILPFSRKGDSKKEKTPVKTGTDETKESAPNGKGKGVRLSMFRKIRNKREKASGSHSTESVRNGGDRDIESGLKLNDDKEKWGKRNMASLNATIAAQFVYCGLLIALMALSRTQTISPYYKDMALTRASISTLLYTALIFGCVHQIYRCGFTGTVFLEILCCTLYVSATLACILLTVMLLRP